jgi:hypothetical protein
MASYDWHLVPQSPCPSCGHCPSCGRAARPFTIDTITVTSGSTGLPNEELVQKLRELLRGPDGGDAA